MREALAGLTTRGRAFVAGGVTAIVCAILLGQTTLVRVGVLVLVLPIITAFVVARSRYQLSLVRTVTPQLVAAGQPARVNLALTNEGRTPGGVLMLEDQLPFVLGSRPRFVLEGVRHGWRRQVGYQVRSDVRGRFELGPMRVRVSDPFGLVAVGPGLPDLGAAHRDPPHRPAAGDPAGRRLDRLGRQPAARLRHRLRRGRHGPGVPPR